MNAYLICTTNGLPLWKCVAEEPRKGWEELFGEGESKFWQSTAQYIVLSSGLLENDKFPFTLSWQGLQCRVLPVQIGDYGLYHIYMQAESLSTSAHRELSFSPFLVCQLLNTILVNIAGKDLMTFLTEASRLSNQRVNNSSFNNTVGDDELAWWGEFLQGHSMTKHLQNLEDNYMKKFLCSDPHLYVDTLLSPYLQHTHRMVFETMQLDKLTERILSSSYYVHTINDAIVHVANLFTMIHHSLHTSNIHILDENLVKQYAQIAVSSQEGVVMIADRSSVVLALSITGGIVVLLICMYPSNNNSAMDSAMQNALLRALIANEEAIAYIEQHCYNKEAYLNVTRKYDADRLMHTGMLRDLRDAASMCKRTMCD